MWHNLVVWKKSSIKEPYSNGYKNGTSYYGLWLEIQKLCVGWNFINLDLSIKDIKEVNQRVSWRKINLSHLLCHTNKNHYGMKQTSKIGNINFDNFMLSTSYRQPLGENTLWWTFIEITLVIFLKFFKSCCVQFKWIWKF